MEQEKRQQLISAITSGNKVLLQKVISECKPFINQGTIEKAFQYLVRNGPVNPRWSSETLFQSTDFESIYAGFLMYQKHGKESLESIDHQTRKKMLQIVNFINHYYKALIHGDTKLKA